MKRLGTLLVLAATGAALLIPGGSVTAAAPRPFSFWDSAVSITGPVEQQNTPAPAQGDVVNPGGCIWNVNDYRNRTGMGYLAGGATMRDSVCEVADWSGSTWMWAHVAWVTLYSTSPNLSLTVTYATGQSAHAGAVWMASQRVWAYHACVAGPTYQPTDAAVQGIAGSNGGWGVPTAATLTVANTGGKSVNLAAGSLVWGIQYGGGCFDGGVALYPPYS